MHGNSREVLGTVRWRLIPAEAGIRVHCCCHCFHLSHVVATADYKSIFHIGIVPCDKISHEIGHEHMGLTRTIRL